MRRRRDAHCPASRAGCFPTRDLETVGRFALASCPPSRTSQGCAVGGGWADRLEIAAALRITNQKAARWRKRFLSLGLDGLTKDAPRPGRKPAIAARLKAEVVGRRRNPNRPMPPIGAPGQWPPKRVSARPRCAAETASSGELHYPQGQAFQRELEDIVGLCARARRGPGPV